MKIVIAGASGFVGRALVAALRGAGHDVRPLVRRAPRTPDEIAWDPAAGKCELTPMAASDAVINLAGENIADGRWTVARRELILRSRVDATRTLVSTLKHLPPKPRVLLSASAAGFYGDRGDEVLDETSAIGHGFLPEVCLAWETHAEGAARLGIRTALLRFGMVLGRDGGALAKMLPLFRCGLGGRLGDGQHWMSWVSMADVVGAVQHVLHDVRCKGPLNIVSPQPVRNAEFAATLGRVLHRPAILPVPAWALRLALGDIAEEALLASERVEPARLVETGYTFRHATLESALRAATTQSKIEN
jgi:uncharacterized protein (TIGR01777 family)